MSIKKISFLVIMSFIMTGVIFAGGIENPTKLNGDLSSMIKMMISGVLKLAIPFLVLAVLYSGFKFTQAQGDPKALQEAKSFFMWLLVGIAIILGANTIYAVIEDTWNSAESIGDNKIELINKIIC